MILKSLKYTHSRWLVWGLFFSSFLFNFIHCSFKGRSDLRDGSFGERKSQPLELMERALWGTTGDTEWFSSGQKVTQVCKTKPASKGLPCKDRVGGISLLYFYSSSLANLNLSGCVFWCFFLCLYTCLSVLEFFICLFGWFFWFCFWFFGFLLPFFF